MEKTLLNSFVHSKQALDEILERTKKPEAAFTDVGKLIYRHIFDFYRHDKNAKKIDVDILLSAIQRELNNEKQFDRIKPSIEGLREPVSVPNVINEYIEQRKFIVGQEIAQSILKGDDKKTRQLMLEWGSLDEGNLDDATVGSEVYSDIDVAEIFQTTKRDNLLKLYPKTLQDVTDGGVVRGDHIIISGRVENGKSLVAINLACGFCHDGHKVLYVGNEDAPARMLPRFISRLSGMPKREVHADYAEAQAKANQNGLGNLIFVSVPAGTMTQLEALVDKFKPDVVVVDQIRNLSVGDDDNRAIQLEKAAYGMRILTKKYNVVGISVTQSANSDQHINKLVGDMSDVSDSKVGIPAQADLLILIGSNEEYRNGNMAMLTIPKNKLSGWHGHFPVRFNTELNKVEDLA